MSRYSDSCSNCGVQYAPELGFNPPRGTPYDSLVTCSPECFLRCLYCRLTMDEYEKSKASLSLALGYPVQERDGWDRYDPSMSYEEYLGHERAKELKNSLTGFLVKKVSRKSSK